MSLVGSLRFTAALVGAERAFVRFGMPAGGTLEAPVDFEAEGHRTLLLGLAANQTVRYRVFVLAGASVCSSEEATFMTGPLPTGSPGGAEFTRGASRASAAPGYIFVPERSFATILNKQGQVVWSHDLGTTLTSVSQSWDGKYMYARDAGQFDAGEGGKIWRVSMDGAQKEELDLPGGSHHDLVVYPDGFAYIAKLEHGACDHIFVAAPDGSEAHSLVDLDPFLTPFPSGKSLEHCHVNSIQYSKKGRFFTVSDRERDVVLKFSEQGEFMASIGQAPSTELPQAIVAEGSGETWRVQHGHDWYQDDSFVVFSNGSFDEGVSRVLHYTIVGAAAVLDWRYEQLGFSPVFSSVRHLENGNFLVLSAQQHRLVEIDPEQEVVWEANYGSSYARHRQSLYGTPSD